MVTVALLPVSPSRAAAGWNSVSVHFLRHPAHHCDPQHTNPVGQHRVAKPGPAHCPQAAVCPLGHAPLPFVVGGVVAPVGAGVAAAERAHHTPSQLVQRAADCAHQLPAAARVEPQQHVAAEAGDACVGLRVTATVGGIVDAFFGVGVTGAVGGGVAACVVVQLACHVSEHGSH